MTPLEGWHDFYVIVGSSAGALTGLQFVVMALVADLSASRSTQTADAFATPTVVHFGIVLLLSGVLTAPWDGTAAPRVLSGLIGGAGLVYSLVVARRMRAQVEYRPVFEDWLFHALLPIAAYAVLIAVAWAPRRDLPGALFAVAGAAMLLLFVGIHNAWDTATYLVYVRREQQQPESGDARD
jgi:hypothetical protein